MTSLSRHPWQTYKEVRKTSRSGQGRAQERERDTGICSDTDSHFLFLHLLLLVPPWLHTPTPTAKTSQTVVG